jgi:hypothetical protein
VAAVSRVRARSGCQLAHLHRRAKARTRVEVIDAALFPIAILLAVAVWVGVVALVG